MPALPTAGTWEKGSYGSIPSRAAFHWCRTMASTAFMKVPVAIATRAATSVLHQRTSIFNRNHAVMRNGDGILGHVSAPKTGLIVPPNNDSLLLCLFHGCRRARSRLRLPVFRSPTCVATAAWGEVIRKTCCLTQIVHVHPPCRWHQYLGDHEREKIQTISKLAEGQLQRHPECTGHFSSGPGSGDNFGQLKASPDGRLVCQTTYPDVAGNNFQLFDFHTFTGQWTNPRQNQQCRSLLPPVCFRPTSRLLYVSHPSSLSLDQF